jgi:hypothetical protein
MKGVGRLLLDLCRKTKVSLINSESFPMTQQYALKNKEQTNKAGLHTEIAWSKLNRRFPWSKQAPPTETKGGKPGGLQREIPRLRRAPGFAALGPEALGGPGGLEGLLGSLAGGAFGYSFRGCLSEGAATVF